MAEASMESRVVALCLEKGLKMTEPRRVIARVLSDLGGSSRCGILHERVRAIDRSISIATVYRTMKLFEEAQIVSKRDFGDGRARYEEINGEEDHHHHMIDVTTGNVIEFYNEELEALKEYIARELGFDLVDHHLELFGVPLKKAEVKTRQNTSQRLKRKLLTVSHQSKFQRDSVRIRRR